MKNKPVNRSVWKSRPKMFLVDLVAAGGEAGSGKIKCAFEYKVKIKGKR